MGSIRGVILLVAHEWSGFDANTDGTSLMGTRMERTNGANEKRGYRRHLRGRTALQANLSLHPTIPGRCPGIKAC